MNGCTLSADQVEITEKHKDSLRQVIGRYLFFDTRLSLTHTKSCGTCHNPDMAFTDGYRKSPGALADLHFRNTPSLINVSRQKYLNWANPDVLNFVEQMETPLFGTDPIEMGLSRSDSSILKQLSADTRYQKWLLQLYPKQDAQMSWERLKYFLTIYVQSINSYNSAYDRFKTGDQNAISASAKLGENLFFSSKFNCSSCHKPPTFGADSTMNYQEHFANIGLYNRGDGSYPDDDQGLFEVTGKDSDKGKFKTPTLRNLDYTAPYFHDGSATDLNEVLDVFESGGRVVDSGPWKGDGRKNPYKHELIKPIEMSKLDRQHLLDFLQTLNDSTILLEKRFQRPNEQILPIY